MAVGLGEPKHARQFSEKLAPSIECITTDDTDLYDLYGIGRGNILKMVSPSALKAGARAASRGHTQGKSTGDVARMTGSFIVDQDGVVRYAYYGENAGDHVDIDTMLADWAAQTSVAAD